MYAEATVYKGDSVAAAPAPTHAQPPMAFPQPPSMSLGSTTAGGQLSAAGDTNWPWSRAGEIVTLHPNSEPLPAAPRSLRTMIVIYENERYSPRLGFSSKGLILGDRGAYSSDDGSMSFPSLEETSQIMLAKGWDFEGDWLIASIVDSSAMLYSAAGKEDGWLYNADFGSFATSAGQAKKGMTHFVRRRRLMRYQVFDERILCDNYLCQSCDLRRIEQLVPLLFEALWKALRAHYGSRELKVDKIIKVKTLMTKALFSLPPDSFSHGAVTQELDNFVRSQGANSIPKVMPAADAAKLLEHYSVLEREGVVRALIRQLDRTFAYHCTQPNCGTPCHFATHRCPNNGCTSKFSMKWWGEHDANCDWKDIPCPLQCGRVVVRKNAEAHMSQECIMRPVPCPYARVGCVPPGLIFRDVQAHCALNHQYHLSLSTAVIDRTTREVVTLRALESGLRSRLAIAETLVRLRK